MHEVPGKDGARFEALRLVFAPHTMHHLPASPLFLAR